MPMGGLNVYPEPQYMYPWVVPAMFFGTVCCPASGAISACSSTVATSGRGRGFSYALYVINGLEQKVTDPNGPITGGGFGGHARQLPRRKRRSEVDRGCSSS